MDFPLAPVRVSGMFSVSTGMPPAILVRIPSTAQGPAHLTVRNAELETAEGGSGAVMSLKWLHDSMEGGAGVGQLRAADCPVRLAPGDAFTWDNPPCGAMLVCLATVAGICAVDGSWR